MSFIECLYFFFFLNICLYLFFFKVFSHSDNYRILNRVPCAIQLVLVGYIFFSNYLFIFWCGSFLKSLLNAFQYCFWFSCMCWEVCGILVPQPGIKPVPPAVEARSPNHWTTREGSAVSSDFRCSPPSWAQWEGRGGRLMFGSFLTLDWIHCKNLENNDLFQDTWLWPS